MARRSQSTLRVLVFLSLCFTPLIVKLQFPSFDFSLTTSHHTRLSGTVNKWSDSTDSRFLVSLSVKTENDGLLNRLKDFVNLIRECRLRILKELRNESWSSSLFHVNEVLTVITETDDLMSKLSAYPSVSAVVFPWIASSSQKGSVPTWSSLSDSSNLLIQRYYMTWTGDQTLCSYVEKTKKSSLPACSNISESSHFYSSLHPFYLSWKQILNETHSNNNNTVRFAGRTFAIHPPALLHIFIIQNVIVTAVGDIIGGSFKYVPKACVPDHSNRFPSHWLQQTAYQEVFVISQYWGNAIFHRMVEIMPRIAPFVDFLNRFPHIKIHGPQTGGRLAELLEVIGIDSSRLITGIVRANIAHIPPPTYCGQPKPQPTQILSNMYRKYIRKNFPFEPQHRLILIRRSHRRSFTQQSEIEKVVEKAARDFNLTYSLFADNPVPSLNETMRLFHAAVMVVAPHGAGLTNVIFSPPGIDVIEGICNPPHINFCLRYTTHVLGHHWHGIMSKGGCEGVVDVDASLVEEAVRINLEIWKQNVAKLTPLSDEDQQNFAL